MGIQAKERQDELFDLRLEKRQLLLALTLSICGSAQDKKEAKTILMELASDPAMAKAVMGALEGNEAHFSEEAPEVYELARRNSGPRPNFPSAHNLTHH